MHTLILDVETYDADLLYSMPPELFVRLAGYRWAGERGCRFTTDLGELRSLILSADMVIGHNIHSFDLPAIFGTGSTIPMELADAGRVYDTWTHAALCHQAPASYVDRNGAVRLGLKPGQAARWNSLDEQAHQLGVAGKTGNLTHQARDYGDPALPLAARIRDGYGKIPTGDPAYRDYLAGDVEAAELLARALLARMPLTPYAMREQRIEARKQVISSQGLRVDIPAARARATELSERREELIGRLARDYGFPTQGVKPWASSAGKAAVLALLEDHGIAAATRPNWTRTAAGALSLGAGTIREVTTGTGAADLGVALAELTEQRVLAQLALDSVQPDGRVHPRITMLQRSGRWSVTRPGLTVWSERDKVKRLEKAIFVPDTGDHVLLELDYSAADARIVAALSGDAKYAAQFEDDRAALAQLTGRPDYADLFKSAGAHAVNAVLAFGADTVATDPDRYRQMAKALGHAWNYGAGPRKLAGVSGLPMADAQRFCNGLTRAYPRLTRWQERVRCQAERTGYVTNPWGRRMRVDRGHEWTQAPALMGQSGTREVICDALLNLPAELMCAVRAQVHDALLVSVPAADWASSGDQLVTCMESVVSPNRGQPIHFPVSCGPAASNWARAGH